MPRKPAPPISVIDPYVDERTALIQEHSASDPDHVYSWQSSTTTHERMERLGQEVVKDSEGKPILHGVGGDVLVKTPKELHTARREVEAKRSYSLVSRLIPVKSAISKTPSAKLPQKPLVDAG